MSAGMGPGLISNTGVGHWVVEEEIRTVFPEPAKWRWPFESEGKGRLEDEYEQSMRSRMWVYLTSIIPKEISCEIQKWISIISRQSFWRPRKRTEIS